MSRTTVLFVLLLLAGSTLTGCAGMFGPKTEPPNPCLVELPDTNRMNDAIDAGEGILLGCPQRQQEVFEGLLAVGRRNPGVQNRAAILDLYKRMMELEVVNVIESKQMLTRYFYVRFAAVDGVEERFSSLSDRALDRISLAIDDELELKKIGLVDVADAPGQYEAAQDYAERMQDILESTKIQWSHLRREQQR